MTNGDARLRQRAARTLDGILHALDAQALGRLDAPIDRAVSSFRFAWKQPFLPADLHRLLGRFLAHVQAQEKADEGPVKPSIYADQAVALVMQSYQGADEGGYDGALHDAMGPACLGVEGIDLVLVYFASILKAIRHQQYTQWVYAYYLDPFDHALKREVVRCVLERSEGPLAEEFRNDDPAELVDQIPQFVEELRRPWDTNQQLRSDRLPPLK